MKSVYIHIPFCKSICSYCDFNKILYDEKFTMPYLESLKREIESRYNNEKIKTLYVGGGTPSSLSINELLYLFEIFNIFDLSELEEFAFECNIDSLIPEKLILFKKRGVNRLSIGIQTFNDDLLKYLGIERNRSKTYETIENIKNMGFENINLDLIYAIPNQTMEMIDKDLDIFLSLNPNHISCYSLMIEPNTKLYVNNEKTIDQDLDYEMYKYIEDRLISNGYNHYEISNYSKIGFESKHNMVYWNNEQYYGFGLSASSYIGDYRIDNVKNIKEYINGNYELNRLDVSSDIMKYELMLGFRKLKGINIEKFNNKFNSNITNMLNEYINDNKMEIKDGYIFISKDWIYKMNEILMELI